MSKCYNNIMKLSKELLELSSSISKQKHKLYIVGGYVRDSLLGLENDDIDIVSDIPLEKLLEICKELKIKTTNINKTFGTLQLTYGKEKFEFTRLRLDQYPEDGSHKPSQVSFTDDVEIDSRRRDFSINAIYYDIKSKEIIDPQNGQKDLENRVLRTTIPADIILRDDALRILRAIRFTNTLGLKIEKKTFSAMKTFAPKLISITKERIIKELNQICVADQKYGVARNTLIPLCNKLRLPKYLFNSRLEKVKFTKKDNTSFNGLSRTCRLIGFYALTIKRFIKTYVNENQLAFITNMVLGINGIKESNNTISAVEKIIRIYLNLTHNIDSINASINYLSSSDATREIVDILLNKKAQKVLANHIAIVKEKNLPLSVHELKVSAQDLIEAGIEKVHISKLLSTLYNQVLNMSVENIKEDLLNIAIEINRTFKEITQQKEKL